MQYISRNDFDVVASFEPCSKCNGSRTERCGSCGGTGRGWTGTCSSCGGSGQVRCGSCGGDGGFHNPNLY